MKVALITGVTGQDGTYLTEFLLNKGYEVHGVKRASSSAGTGHLTHLDQPGVKFKLHFGDMTDAGSLTRLVQQIQPDEIYNLAAMTSVQVSFEAPEYTANTDGLGTLRMLEAVRLSGLTKKTRIFQASTSELYGLVPVAPQSETTPFYPRTPYAVAKLYSYWIVVNYREAHHMYACNGILFNHESPIRGEAFITRKITLAAAKIGLGLQQCLYVGNLSASRDWGHARDYVEAMWLMLQQGTPEDYVIASGITTTVRDFIKMAFDEIGIEIEFSGRNENERGVIIDVDEQKALALGLDLGPLKMGQTIVRVDPQFFRPIGVELLMGDPTKAETQLGWKRKYNLQDLVKDMMKADLQLAKKEGYLQKGGFVTQNHLE